MNNAGPTLLKKQYEASGKGEFFSPPYPNIPGKSGDIHTSFYFIIRKKRQTRKPTLLDSLSVKSMGGERIII
jgi:hypothetical protein